MNHNVRISFRPLSPFSPPSGDGGTCYISPQIITAMRMDDGQVMQKLEDARRRFGDSAVLVSPLHAGKTPEQLLVSRSLPDPHESVQPGTIKIEPEGGGGKGDGSLWLSPAFERAIPSIAADLHARLERYGIDGQIGLRVVDAIRARATGEAIPGAEGRYARRLIEVALGTRDGAFVLDHEAVHALRDLGLIHPAEWRALKRDVLQDGDRMADVRARYRDMGLSHDDIVEEAIADRFAEWQRDRAAHQGMAGVVLRRVADFLRAVGQALRGEGFHTVDSVFRAIDRGEVGRRAAAAEMPAGGMAEAFQAGGDKFRRGRPLSATEQSLADSILAEQPGFAERARKAFTANRSGLGSELVRQFVNQFQPIFDAEMRAEGKVGRQAALRDARVSAAKFTEMSMDDRTGTLIEDGPLQMNPDGSLSYVKGIGGLAEIFKPLDNPEDYKRFSVYAIARRAQRLKAEGRENLLSDAQIKAGMALRTPVFEKIFDGYQKFNRAMLDFVVDTGIIKAESRDFYAQSMDYIPFHRVMEETGEVPNFGMMKKLSNPDPKIRKLEGGSEKIGDVAENIIRNATQLARAGMRNEAMRRIHGILEELGEAKTLTGADEKAGSAAFFDKGVKRHFIADDPALMAALGGLKPEQQNGILKAMASFSNLLRRGITAAPPFQLANTIRDTGGAFVQTGKSLSLANNAATGILHAMRNDAVIREMKAATGLGSYEFGHTPADAAGKLKRTLGIEVARTPGQIIDKILHPLEKAGGWTELANRDALYRNLIKKGVDPFEAAYQAKNLLNFSRKGANSALRFLLPLVPFLNARIQGLYRLAETQGNPAALKGVMARGLMLTGLSAALYAAFGDDERAKDEPLERRLNYYIVYPTKDSRVLIPKPFEFGAVFSTMPEFLFDAIAREDGDDLAKATAMTLLNTFSFNPIPQAVRPALEAATNYDFFTGRAIEGAAQQRLAPGERADARTSGALKMLGRETNISPMQMEHLIGGYLGTLGQTAIAGFDAILGASGAIPSKPAGAFGSVPILSPVLEQAFGRFYKEGPDAANRWVGDFYDLKHKADETFQTIRRLREEGEIERAQELRKGNADLIGARRQLTKMAEQIGGLSQRINAIRGDDEMSPEEKRSRLDALIARRNAVARRMPGVLENIKKRRTASVVGDDGAEGE